MAKKTFDYQFEDIRRESTPVSAAGFGDMIEEPENPDEAFVDVDLDADNDAEAVSVAAKKPDEESGNNNDDTDNDDVKKDRRRQAIEDRKARQKADRLEQELDDGRREFAGEVNTLKKEVATLKAEKEVNAIDDEYASREDELTAEMEQAMEDGDTKKTARINSQLIALNSEKQAKKAAAEASVSVIEDLNADEQPTGDRPASKRATEFIRRNESWWRDPDHDDAEDYARRLDKKLVAMGFNPEEDPYWERFNHNFDKKFPDLRVKDPDDIDIDLDEEADDKPNRGRRRSPVAQPGGAGSQRRSTGGGGNNNQSGSKVTLTQAHKANMVRFGLDPTDPEHCANYAKQVQATKAQDARRAS